MRPFGFPLSERIGDTYCNECKEKLNNLIEGLENNQIRLMGPIKDPIIGYIEVDKKAQILLSTCYLQRLRRLLHLSFVYLAYPSAMHTRFEHSIGCYHYAQQILENKYFKERILPVDSFKVKVAALLHDIGQGPFSHLFDALVSSVKKTKPIKHEYFSRMLVNPTVTPYVGDIQFGVPETCLAKILHEIINKTFTGNVYPVDIPYSLPYQIRYDISYMINKDDHKHLTEFKRESDQEPFPNRDPLGLRYLINSDLDVDKLDYLVRDAHHAGATFAKSLDTERICQSIQTDNQGILIESRVVGCVLQLLFARGLAFSELYSHKVNRIAIEMILKAFFNALVQFDSQGNEVRSDSRDQIEEWLLRSTFSYEFPLFYEWDDFHFVYQLLNSNKSTEGLKTATLRVLNRDLFKQVLGYRITLIPDSKINPETNVRWRRKAEWIIGSDIESEEELYEKILIYSYEDPFPKSLASLARIRISDSEGKTLAEYLPFVNIKEFVDKLQALGLLIWGKYDDEQKLLSIVNKLVQELNLQRHRFILYVCSTKESVSKVSAVQETIEKILCTHLGNNIIDIERIYMR